MSAPICSCDVYNYNGSKRTCSQAAELTAKLEAAEMRSEYWKAEHLAGNSVIAEQSAQIESLEKDAARLDWFERMFVHSWNGVIGTGSLTYCVLAGDYRHQVAKMRHGLMPNVQLDNGKPFKSYDNAMRNGIHDDCIGSIKIEWEE